MLLQSPASINKHQRSVQETFFYTNTDTHNCESVLNDLVKAASHRDLEAFKFIFKREGGNPFARPKNRECSAFHIAAMVGCTELVRYILENCTGNKHKYVNLREDDCNKTALHFAATNGYVKTVEYLLGIGAEPDPLSFDFWTPMHYAAENGHAEVIVVLLNYGADPNTKNETSQTPAHLAAVYDHPQCFQVFVQHYGNRAIRIMGETARVVRLSVPGLIAELCRKIAAFAVPPADLDVRDDWEKSPTDWVFETTYCGSDLGWAAVNIDWDANIANNWFF